MEMNGLTVNVSPLSLEMCNRGILASIKTTCKGRSNDNYGEYIPIGNTADRTSTTEHHCTHQCIVVRGNVYLWI